MIWKTGFNLLFNIIVCLLPTHFFSFFCAAFFFTICRRFIALSWDSWEVGVLPSAEAFAPLLLLLLLLLLLPPLLPPLPPPLPPDPPLPPRLLEGAAPGDKDPVTVIFPKLSPLAERLNTCLPSVSGGGGFIGTVLEPLFPLPLPPLLPPEGLLARPGLTLASAESPTGLEPEGGGVDLLLPGWLVLNLVLEGPTFEVLVKAAHPVRPWGKDELLLEEFPDAADAWT